MYGLFLPFDCWDLLASKTDEIDANIDVAHQFMSLYLDRERIAACRTSNLLTAIKVIDSLIDDSYQITYWSEDKDDKENCVF